MADTPPEISAWLKVRNALAHPRFDFRTVEGIVRETGLAAKLVQILLNEHSEEVRKALGTSKDGRILYTLRDRPKKLQEYLSDVKIIVSGTSTST